MQAGKLDRQKLRGLDRRSMGPRRAGEDRARPEDHASTRTTPAPAPGKRAGPEKSGAAPRRSGPAADRRTGPAQGRRAGSEGHGTAPRRGRSRRTGGPRQHQDHASAGTGMEPGADAGRIAGRIAAAIAAGKPDPPAGARGCREPCRKGFTRAVQDPDSLIYTPPTHSRDQPGQPGPAPGPAAQKPIMAYNKRARAEYNTYARGRE